MGRAVLVVLDIGQVIGVLHGAILFPDMLVVFQNSLTFFLNPILELPAIICFESLKTTSNS